ncbi:9769_t:CDS:2, partial [Dentiscutata erythropus]
MNNTTNETINEATNDAMNKAMNEATNKAMNEATNKAMNDTMNKATNDATNNTTDNTMNIIMGIKNTINMNMNNTISMNDTMNMNNAISMNDAMNMNNAISMNNAINMNINDTISMNNRMNTDNYFLISEKEQNNLNINNAQIQTSIFRFFYNDDSDIIVSTYQYNLHIEDPFDDWLSVDIFIYQYCLEHGFGYQIFHNDKDPDNHSITYRKSFHCSSSENYKAQKILIRIRIVCELEILKEKYPHHEQAIYNMIYKNCNNRNEINSDSGSFLNALYEKVQDANWKVFVWHTEDILDELQATLQSLLSNLESKNIIETWRVRRIGGLSHKENLVILFANGSHICTYFNVKNSSVLTTLESPSNSSFQVTFAFQSIQNFNKSTYNEVDHKHVLERNQYGIAFSIAKTAINIALENNKDAELNISTENYNSKQNQNTSEIISLQQHSINQIISPKVTKIHGTLCKKRIKTSIEISKEKVLNEISNTVQEANYSETSSKQQHKCLIYKKPDHYQKKCPL